MRAHFPQHSQPIVEGFKRLQMKLICSYHAINFEDQYRSQMQQIIRLYKIAALPVHNGGMGLGCIESAHSVAFIASMVAVIPYLAKAYPSWIQINNERDKVTVVEDLQLFTRDQIMNYVNLIKTKAPQGALRGLDSLSAIFQNFFVAAMQQQDQQQEQSQSKDILYGLAEKEKKTGLIQSIIYSDLVQNLIKVHVCVHD